MPHSRDEQPCEEGCSCESLSADDQRSHAQNQTESSQDRGDTDGAENGVAAGADERTCRGGHFLHDGSRYGMQDEPQNDQLGRPIRPQQADQESQRHQEFLNRQPMAGRGDLAEVGQLDRVGVDPERQQLAVVSHRMPGDSVARNEQEGI